jgi:regulator of protease activity HflC (stomatin/prohibitin superfamily)
MSDTMVILLLGLIMLGTLTVIWFVRRVHTVPEGHVAIIQFMNRHSRVVGSGPYWLRPFEEEATRLFVRQREVRNLDIPNIFTHGGMPLNVMLDYEMRLNPHSMDQDELYYEEFEREDQQTRVLKGILQDLVRDLPRPPAQKDTNRADIDLLFSPFLTQSAQIRAELEQRAISEMANCGVEISKGTLLISRLKLPDNIISAYTDALAMNFSGAAQHELIQRLRNAGTNMSDMALIQLVNAIKENSGDFNTIFASGGFPPDVRVQTANATVQVPGTPAPQATPPPPAPSQPQGAAQSSNGVTNVPDGDLPLTSEDMALLRSAVE